MRHSTPGLTLAGIAAVLLVACSSGGGGSSSSSSSSGGTANVAPIANAGANQTVTSGTTVTLNGTASSDSDGSIAAYAWTQTAGTAVTLSSTTASQPTFSAPTVASATALTFSLIVTDNRGSASPASTMTVTVNPPAAGNTNVTGNITFARVPFATAGQDGNRGLWYATPIQQPARGVIVRALNAGTVLATGSTDNLGNYSLSVAANTTITIDVVARMLRDASQALPRWDVRVQDGSSASGTAYTYSDGLSFNSSGGTAHNIAISTGINASGTATGTRASAPFAILDTIYQGIQTVTGVAPTTTFPTLIVDWGSQVDGTFFTTAPTQRIALLSALATDTDEFDQHVIAHEFGHYIEFNFSRADNIGGAHGLGDKLDPRVAFGEGFGYAFAAIVLNDPVARDSANDNGDLWSSAFNVETNPSTTPVAGNDNYGCWCSESSVYSLIWDLYDNTADTNDFIALGFAPIWDVLTGAQRTTPAHTTIFSFIAALKAARPGDTGAINTLVNAQNIVATNIDAFATGETHVPTNVTAANVLPLYTTITASGTPVVVRNVNDAGTYNKIGNHRFLRFTPNISGQVSVSLTSSNTNNADPDFWVYRSGNVVLIADDGPPQPETGAVTVTAGTTYVLDVYDCANGCSTEQGVAGDYDLTVTIN